MNSSIDLMIIGAPKAGTTALNTYLAQHPNIYTHFTTEFNMFGSMEDFNKGLEYNINETVHKSDLKNPDKNHFIAKRVGVMYDVEKMQNLFRHSPDCKVVAILRNPIDRAFSAFKYTRMSGVEPYRNFEDAIFINDKSRFKGNKNFERNCDYVFRSNYLPHIQNMYKIFPAENIKIFLFEGMIKNSTTLLNEMVGMLNLPPFEFDTSKPVNEGAFAKSDAILKVIAPGKFAMFKKFFSLEQRMKMKLFLKKLNASKGSPEQRKMKQETRNHLLNVFKNDVIELERISNLPIKQYWPEFF